MLRTEPPLARLLARLGPPRCVAVAPPALAAPALADAMRAHTVSVVREHDIIPHCSMGQVAKLREEVRAAHWGSRARMAASHVQVACAGVASRPVPGGTAHSGAPRGLLTGAARGWLTARCARLAACVSHP